MRSERYKLKKDKLVTRIANMEALHYQTVKDNFKLRP